MASDHDLQALRDALEQARMKLIEQDELLSRIMEAPLGYATVVAEGVDDKGQDYLVVNAGGGLNRIIRPKKPKVEIGDTVVVAPMSNQIISVEPMQFGGGISVVKTAIDKHFSEIDGDVGGGGSVVFNGRVKKPEPGDRVVMDSSGQVMLRKLPKEKNAYVRDQGTGVTWDSIGGLIDAKAQMIEAVELPRLNPKIFEYYSKAPPKGILLFGPPGCGKTLLGKAAATSLSSEGQGGGFMYVKAPEILDRFVGVAEGNIRAIFNAAKAYKARTGHSAVVFIDEADAVLGRRGAQVSSDIGLTVVPSFLTEMDGLDQTGALVILATNRPDALDPAVVRDGRIDRKIKVTRPDRAATSDIFCLNLERTPLANGHDKRALAEETAEAMFCPSKVVYHLTTNKGRVDLTLGDLINGAMVAGVVERAASRAMRRDLAAKTRTGVHRDDMMAAVNESVESMRDLDVGGELRDMLADSDADILSITRPRMAVAAE